MHLLTTITYSLNLIICLTFVVSIIIIGLLLQYETNKKLKLYNNKLKSYYKRHEHRFYLINKNCEARYLLEGDSGSLSLFYVKERGVDKTGRYFEVSNLNHVNLVWAIFDMEFNKYTTYEKLIELCHLLNITIIESTKTPTHILGKHPFAQNEFCRMEWEMKNKKNVIICSEIWGTPDFDKPKHFEIVAESKILMELFQDFANRNNKTESYSELLKQYSNRNDCEVITSNNSDKIEIETFQQTKLSTEKSEETREEKSIEKYDERNIDL